MELRSRNTILARLFPVTLRLILREGVARLPCRCGSKREIYTCGAGWESAGLYEHVDADAGIPGGTADGLHGVPEIYPEPTARRVSPAGYHRQAHPGWKSESSGPVYTG